MAAVGVMNFLCAMFVTCFCACAGLAGHQEAPVFRREALDMVLTGALFALPYLFMPVLLRYFTTRFSSRNTVTFSQLAGVILMGAGALLFLPGNGRIGASGTILLLFLVMLTGMDYAAYRSALRIYIAETVAKSRLPLAGAVTESTTFAGIVAGIAGAGIASGLEFSRGMAGAFLTVVASLSLSVATRLAPTLAPSPKLRFSGLPKTWLAVIRKDNCSFRR